MATSKLPFGYAAVDEASILTYQDNLPSGPYWQWMESRGGNIVWTDGSRKDMGPEHGLRVGYGTYSTTPLLNQLSGRVGGEAVPIWGEYAAIA
eukprot:456780-Rhodomonas_salina.1